MSQTANRKFLLVCLASSDGTVSFLIRRKHSDNPVSRTHENAFSDHISLFANDRLMHPIHAKLPNFSLARCHTTPFSGRAKIHFSSTSTLNPLWQPRPASLCSGRARDCESSSAVAQFAQIDYHQPTTATPIGRSTRERPLRSHSQLGPILRTSKNQILNTDQPWKLALGWRRRNVFGSGLNSPVRAGDSRARVTLMVRNGRRKTAIERAVEYATGAKRTYVAPESPVI